MSLTVTITCNNARTGRKEDVAEIHIVNDGTGTPERGNYTYRVRTGEQEISGRVEGFRRNHPHGAARLLAVVLRKAVPFEPEYAYLGTGE